MKNLILTVVIVLAAAIVFSQAAVVAHADGASAIMIKKWGYNYEDAKAKCYDAAEHYSPYQVVGTDQGWDPNHIPHDQQWYYVLWIVPAA